MTKCVHGAKRGQKEGATRARNNMKCWIKMVLRLVSCGATLDVVTLSDSMIKSVKNEIPLSRNDNQSLLVQLFVVALRAR